jgi:hypothetical protein
MSRRPAKITQADVARAVRAAKQAGAGTVRLLPDGTICIDIQAQPAENKSENAVDAGKDITL